MSAYTTVESMINHATSDTVVMTVDLLRSILAELPAPVKPEPEKKSEQEWKSFSPMQTKLLYWTYDSINGENADYYYAETGPCKPWSVNTVKSLVKKGYVTADEVVHGVFYVRLTEKGQETGRLFHDNLDSIELFN